MPPCKYEVQYCYFNTPLIYGLKEEKKSPATVTLDLVQAQESLLTSLLNIIPYLGSDDLKDSESKPSVPENS